MNAVTDPARDVAEGAGAIAKGETTAAGPARKRVGGSSSPEEPIKVAVLLGAEPYQVHHVAAIAWQMSQHRDVEVEVVATLPESLEEFDELTRTANAPPLPRRLLHTPVHLAALQKLTVLGSLKTAVMAHPSNRAMFSRYAAIVTPTDHAGVLRPLLDPRPLMIYVNHGIGSRAASYSDKYLNFDFVVVASPKDERRLLADHLIRPGSSVVAYPKIEFAQRVAASRPRLFANERPVVLFNPHSKRSLRSWERFARPLIDHAAATGEFNLIVAPHVKLFRRRPRWMWRRWERLAVSDRVIVDLGSRRSLDMTYTFAADIYVGDVSSQISEFLTEPRPCVFLNAHGIDWRGNRDFSNWELGDVAQTPEEAIEAIGEAAARHPHYEPLQRKRIDGSIDPRPDPAGRAARAIVDFIRQQRKQPSARVMFLVSDLGTGGTARATMLTVNGLAQEGVGVSLGVMRRGGVLEPQLDRSVRFLPLEAGAIRGPGMLLALNKLVKRLRAEQPDKLVSAGNHMHVLATLAHALARVPGCELVLKMTNPIERPNKSRLSNALRRAWHRWAFKRASKVLLITEAARDEFARRSPAIAGKLAVVDNPYITDAMLAAGRERHHHEEGRLLAIGRLVPQKNYPLLLRALAQIPGAGWTLDVLGDGPLLPQLERLTGDLGIADRVTFRGYVSDPLPYLKTAHALVLSSSWEGQGAVLLEALACGCPVIATRSTEAVADVLGDGEYGRLVPPGDAAALASAIEAELSGRTRLPASTRKWVQRYRLDAGARSHARALGLEPSRAAPRQVIQDPII